MESRAFEAERQWVDNTCTPHPFAAFAERIPLTGELEKIGNKTYICAAGYDPSPFKPIYDEVKQRPGWKLHELNCGHDTMIDLPEEQHGSFWKPPMPPKRPLTPGTVG